MRKLILLMLLCGLSMAAKSQYIIVGRLVSGKDGQPMPYANVALMRASDSLFLRGTVTDEQGHYRIDNDTLPTLLRLSAMGYATQYVPVPNTRYGGPTGLGQIEMGTTTLQEGAMLLDVVRIVEQKPLYAVDGEKSLYNVTEDASVQAGTASDALQNAPGVEVDVEGNVTLNGQSATVWINDRPSHLEGESLKQYIKTLPANNITRIEVIKNPSARYGSSGPVVNIVTNRTMLLNSFVSFGANGTSRPSISPWASYVYSNQKFNISAYISYTGSNNVNTDISSGSLMYDTLNSARRWSTVDSGFSRHHYTWISLNYGYQFDSMNSLNGWFGAYPSKDIYRSSDYTIRWEWPTAGGDSLDYSHTSGSHDTAFNHGGFGGLWFTHKFNNEGHQYSISVNGNWWRRTVSSTDFQHYATQPQRNYDQYALKKVLDGRGSIRFDYSLPYSKNGELEMGLDMGMDSGHNYYLRDTLDADGRYHCDILRSDTSRTTGNEQSAYLTWRRKWGGLTMKLGLRGERSVSTSRHDGWPQYDTSVTHYTASPSLHLSYQTHDMHNFSLSYTLRTNTPSASLLSRYESYAVESYSTGNPNLKKSQVHTLEASWNKFFSKFGSVGLSGSYVADLGKSATLTDARYVPYFGRVVNYNKPENVGDTRRANLDFNIMYRPSAFFNVRLSGGVNDTWYRLQVRPGDWQENEVPSWNARLRVWTKLWNKVEVFVSGNYNSRGLSRWTLLYLEEANDGINLGASADFFDRKLSLYLNCNDILNRNHWASTSLNPYTSSTSDYRWNSRYLTFGLTLRMGKMELESRARTGATEDSSGRK